MPYNAIPPFRRAVERIVKRPEEDARPDLGFPSPSGTFNDGDGNSYSVDWSDVCVDDLQGFDPSNPDGKRSPGEQFVSVTQLPDGAMGQFLSRRPDGLLRVTMQMDVWHAWRVAAEDLADAVSRVLDGGVAPGLASIQSDVRAAAWDPEEVKWRVSQRFAVTAYDER